MLRVVCQLQGHHPTVCSYRVPALVMVAVVDSVKHLKLFHHLILPVTRRELLLLKELLQRSLSHLSVVESFAVKEECVHQRPPVR